MRSLDLSHRVTGNAIAHAMADHAAKTIKIKLPDIGYALRNWEMRDLSTSRKVYCRNKNVTLNLRTARGRAILLDLAATAEVIAVNFIPSRLEE